MTNPRSIVISANPKSGVRSGLEAANALRVRLEAAGYLPELFTDLDAMTQRSRQLNDSGTLRAVVAGGGDGTASLVLSLIPTGTPLLLYPLGSENLLARYLGIDLNLDLAIEIVNRRVISRIDLFEANSKLMLLMASVGFDAEVVRQVHVRRIAHVTRWDYRWSIVSALRTYSWPSFRVSTHTGDGQWCDRGTFNWLFAFNVPRYAAGISIIDDALCDDGWIDVGAFQGGGLVRGLWHYWLVARGWHRRAASWHEWKAKGVRVEIVVNADHFHRGPESLRDATASAAASSFQIDGDWGGALPLEIQYTGRRAPLLVPPHPSSNPRR